MNKFLSSIWYCYSRGERDVAKKKAWRNQFQALVHKRWSENCHM